MENVFLKGLTLIAQQLAQSNRRYDQKTPQKGIKTFPESASLKILLSTRLSALPCLRKHPIFTVSIAPKKFDSYYASNPYKGNRTSSTDSRGYSQNTGTL